ncbi:hypothetical protein [Flavobacterium sp.]|uniref:hypothetical protein n=1 Tax=Flavobacterium sp. TaxID=239 RepID=UPI002C493AC7|nr:hypothetical protein [Flavobacterium sp.]HSD07912.1 hypothetical protein [Flavobacterium sp.]
MLDYFESIKNFIAEQFTPSNPENANVKMTTNDLLEFLFRTFPVNCISDYELNVILMLLGYVRHTYVVESYTEVGKKKDKKIEVRKSLEVGWCLKSAFDLHTEVLDKK